MSRTEKPRNIVDHVRLEPPYHLDRRESRRDMEAIGRNIGETKKNLAQRRIKQGRCPTCGTKTHKVGFFGKKTALTVEGQALYGRCLMCEPVEGYTTKRQSAGHNHLHGGDDYCGYDGPRQLAPGTELMFSDDSTLVSGITMEPGLIDYARRWESMGDAAGDDNLARWDEEEDDELEQKSHKRPEPSLASFDNDRPSAPTRRRSSGMPILDEGSERPNGRTGNDAGSVSRHSRERRMNQMNHVQSFRAVEEEESEPLPEQIFAEQIARQEKKVIKPARPLTPPRALTPQNDKDSSSSPKPSSPDSRPLQKFQEVEFSLNVTSDQPMKGHRKNASEESKNEIEAPFHFRSPPKWGQVDPNYYISNDSTKNAKDAEQPLRDRDSPFTAHSRDSSDFRQEKPEMPVEVYGSNMSEISSHMESIHSRSIAPRPPNLLPEIKTTISPGTSPVASKQNVKAQRAPSTPLEPLKVEPPNGFGTNHINKGGRPTHAKSTDDSPGGPPLIKSRGQPDEDVPIGPMSPRAKPPIGNRKNDAPERQEAVEQLSLSPLSQKKPIAQPDRIMDSPNSTSSKVESIDNVPYILHSLNLNEANSKMREKAFMSLARLVWQHGEKVKTIIAKYKGIETLVRSMWASMDNVMVQEAATYYLFALASSSDGIADNDVLSGESAEGAVDALLIAMQTHISVESIQRDGCGTLCCLATAAANNKKVDDGTASGAVMIILQAMDGHRTSTVLQEWGVRALYAQCVYSVNAESNKRSLVQSDFERNVLLRALDICKSELSAAEWVCRLFWCLTSHEEVSKTLSVSPALLYSILDLVQSFYRKPKADRLTEAAYGIIANLSLEENLIREVLGSGVASSVVDSMKFHRSHQGLHVEACALLANLAFEPSSRDNIVRAGGVAVIVSSMMGFRGNAALIEEGLRALISLSIGSDDAKAGVASAEILGSLLRVCEDHVNVAAVQELVCIFLAALSSRISFECVVYSCGGSSALVKAMNAHPKERKLQEAACVAFRNMACSEEDTSDLLRGEFVYPLTKAMANHEDSEIVQRNVCCALWNIVFKASEEPESIVKCDGTNHMVKAMLSHLESGALQEMACGAIWSLVDESEERKNCVFGNGGIEAVTCALVMHPDEVGTLETACGVLSNLSAIAPVAQAIAQAQGVSGVVEAMRNHCTSVALLEYGSLTLRNIIVADPEYADEAVPAISIIINGMRENPDAVSFQEEACYALWVMAAQSENCRSRILALDGITALISTLEHNNCVADVQAAARGAFNQLASANTVL